MQSHCVYDVCRGFQSRTLFYPASGLDIFVPIRFFLPFIDEFWFVDPLYNVSLPLLIAREAYRIYSPPAAVRYQRDPLHVPYARSQRDAQRAEFVLRDMSFYELTGVTIRTRSPFRVPVSCQEYEHLPTGRLFKVHVCCGRGYDVFRAAFRLPGKQLSVFFHRGDSNEGGSGFFWLTQRIAPYLFAHLEQPALVVSDGSLAEAKFRIDRKSITQLKSISEIDSFVFVGRQLTCVGYFGERGPPALIWRVDVVQDDSALSSDHGGTSATSA